LAIRIGFVLARPHLVAAGDPASYLGQANLLVEGKGWIEPFAYARHVRMQTADLPPLYTLLLAVCSVAFKSFFAHRIWSALLSCVGIVLAAGLGRDLAGPSVGVVAAFGYALYPNLWMSPGLGMSETISPVLVLAVLWASYRAWDRPTWPRLALVGLAVGVAALARDELVLLGPLIMVPLVFGRAGLRSAASWRALAAGLGAIVVVIGPWILFNSIRFSQPVLITDRFGSTLAVANCDPTYNGPLAGFWSFPCENQPNAGQTEPQVDAANEHKALRYIDHHLGDLPRIEAERVGRTFGFYEPLQQIRLDIFVESRPHFWAFAGLYIYYGLALLSIYGGWLLRRRGVPIWPMLAVVIDVLVVCLTIYGNTRFRAPLEPVLVLLASVAIVEIFRRIGPRSLGSRPPEPERSREPSGPSSDAVTVSGRPAGAAFLAIRW
jgi:4-amino-4-deoxy-L-arabinose transferase-like glycosyltransferase